MTETEFVPKPDILQYTQECLFRCIDVLKDRYPDVKNLEDIDISKCRIVPRVGRLELDYNFIVFLRDKYFLFLDYTNTTVDRDNVSVHLCIEELPDQPRFVPNPVWDNKIRYGFILASDHFLVVNGEEYRKATTNLARERML